MGAGCGVGVGVGKEKEGGPWCIPGVLLMVALCMTTL